MKKSALFMVVIMIMSLIACTPSNKVSDGQAAKLLASTLDNVSVDFESELEPIATAKFVGTTMLISNYVNNVQNDVYVNYLGDSPTYTYKDEAGNWFYTNSGLTVPSIALPKPEVVAKTDLTIETSNSFKIIGDLRLSVYNSLFKNVLALTDTALNDLQIIFTVSDNNLDCVTLSLGRDENRKSYTAKFYNWGKTVLDNMNPSELTLSTSEDVSYEFIAQKQRVSAFYSTTNHSVFIRKSDNMIYIEKYNIENEKTTSYYSSIEDGKTYLWLKGEDQTWVKAEKTGDYSTYNVDYVAPESITIASGDITDLNLNNFKISGNSAVAIWKCLAVTGLEIPDSATDISATAYMLNNRLYSISATGKIDGKEMEIKCVLTERDICEVTPPEVAVS